MPDTPPALRDACQRAFEQIDSERLFADILEVCNLYTPYGWEKEAGEWVHDWLGREAFAPRRIGMVPERFNVAGRLAGAGGGRSLLFSSHLDTTGPKNDPTDGWKFSQPYGASRYLHEAWIEDGHFKGMAVENDKGPLVCFLHAARAIRRAGLKLAGDVHLTACPGEMGQEPVDEFEGLPYLSKETGAEYLMVHGGIFADFAIAAEGTDFGVSWLEAGKAFFKITLKGRPAYTPMLQHGPTCAEHPGPLYQAGALIPALLEWGRDYEARHRYESQAGTCIPKVQIGAIRGGHPFYIIGGSSVCHLYLDCRLTPKMTPATVRAELEALIEGLGLDAEIALFVHRPAYEASAEAIGPFHEALKAAHATVFDEPLGMAEPVYSSMWRDHQVFIKYGIPGVTYGPGRFEPSLEEMVQCTRAYAAAAIATCGLAE